MIPGRRFLAGSFLLLALLPGHFGAGPNATSVAAAAAPAPDAPKLPVTAQPPAAALPPAAAATGTRPATPKPSAALGTVPGRESAEPAPRMEARFTPAAVCRDLLLTEDTVWRGEVLVEGTVTVAPQATLSLEPGTVVRFRGVGAEAALLMVQGRIVAVGARELPVLFTSIFDTPAAGDWQGVMLLGSEKKNLMENVRIEGAQNGIEALFGTLTLKNVRIERSTTGLRAQDALLSMEEGGVFGCELGMSLAQSEASLGRVSVEGNLRGLWAKRSSLYLAQGRLAGNRDALSAEGCRLKLEGGEVSGNGRGVTLGDCEGAVTGMVLAENREYGLSLAGSRVRVSANRIEGNGGSGLIVHDGLALAWNNSICDNSGYDLYNAGSEEFRAPGNWWGGPVPRLFENAGGGRVLYRPQLKEKPDFRPSSGTSSPPRPSP